MASSSRRLAGGKECSKPANQHKPQRRYSRCRFLCADEAFVVTACDGAVVDCWRGPALLVAHANGIQSCIFHQLRLADSWRSLPAATADFPLRARRFRHAGSELGERGATRDDSAQGRPRD
jgi:hypothetical protein